MRGGNTGIPQIVLDTNVLVSGMLSGRGAPAGILNLVVNGEVILVLDTRIFEEYADVLQREKFGFPADAVDDILGFIKKEGIFVAPAPLANALPDPGDLPFVEVARHAGVPVVTGNARHFRDADAEVLTPADSLERYREGM